MEDEASFVYTCHMELDERHAIAGRIAESRRSAGLTQRELADRLGVTVRTVQNYEAGVAVPYRHLRSIESLGHKPPGWILRGGDDSRDLLATVLSLQETMEHHYELLTSHLEELQHHMSRLRDARTASVDRRAARATDSVSAVGDTPRSTP